MSDEVPHEHLTAAVHEPEQEERQDEEEHLEHSELDESSTTQHDGEQGSAAKTKRKKKKKKSKDGGLEAFSEGEAHADKSSKEADKRLQGALESIKGGEDMWVLLGQAKLQDSLVDKLMDALQSNSSVTSIDLSGNQISDDGAMAIVAALQQGAARELINLDLRGNPVGEEAEHMLTALSRSRKQLTVELGPLLEDPSDHSNSNGSAPGTPTGKRRGAVKKLQQQKQQQERAQEKALQLAQQRQAAGNGAGRQQAVGPAGGDFRQSPMFRRFFVAGNSDAPDAQPNTTSEEEEAAEVPDIAPQEIWDKVRDLLPGGSASIPAIGEMLRSAASCLDSEVISPVPVQDADADVADSLTGASSQGESATTTTSSQGESATTTTSSSNSSSSSSNSAGASAGAAGAAEGHLVAPGAAAAAPEGPMEGAGASSTTQQQQQQDAVAQAAGLDGLQPHTQFAANQLALLRSVLALEPTPVLTQFSPQQQPALGTHRLWAADVLALLLLASQPGIDAAVHLSGVLPFVVALALSLDKCNALHFRVLQMLHCCVRSREEGLWRGLFQEGLGVGISNSGVGGAYGKEACPPLHELLACIAADAEKQPVGQRQGRVGFAVRAAQVLLEACDKAGAPDMFNAGLDALLAQSDAWVGSTEPGGALHALLVEQEGDLCGPKPMRLEALSEEGIDDGIGGGSVITGEQLLAMLHDMASTSASSSRAE